MLPELLIGAILEQEIRRLMDKVAEICHPTSSLDTPEQSVFYQSAANTAPVVPLLLERAVTPKTARVVLSDIMNAAGRDVEISIEVGYACRY
jgi:hypothetical protein